MKSVMEILKNHDDRISDNRNYIHRLERKLDKLIDVLAGVKR